MGVGKGGWGGGGTDLVRRITNTHIKIRQRGLDTVPQHHLEPLLFWPTLDTFCELGRHARVHLDGDDAPRLLEDLDRQIASPGTDFEDDVALLETGFVDDGLCHARVLEDVLAEVGVHLEDVVDGFCGGGFGAGGGGGGGAGVGGGARGGGVGFAGFGHCDDELWDLVGGLC